MKAVLCPVCKGEGIIPALSGAAIHRTCIGCDGDGWVTVPEEPKETVYIGAPLEESSDTLPIRFRWIC